MSMTPRESLLELCSDHFHGLISTETYRHRRAELLDHTILGREPAAQSVSAATAESGTAEAPMRRAAAAAERAPQAPSEPRPVRATSSAEPAASRGVPLSWIGGGVAVLLFVAAGAWWLGRSSGVESEPAVESAPSAAVVAEPSATVRPEDDGSFVTRFIATDAWDEAALSEFLYEWDLLSDGQRDAVRASHEFRSLDERIRGRLLELRALADSSVPESVDRVRLVAGFARELGFNPEVGDLPLAAPVVAAAPVVSPPAIETEAPASAGEPAIDAPAPTPRTVVKAPGATPKGGAATTPSVQPAAVAPSDVQPVAETPVRAQPESARVATANGTAEAPSTDQVAVIAVPSTVQVAIPSARPCRREVAEVVPLPPANRRSCFDNIAGDVRGPLLLILPAGQFTQGSNEDKAATPAHIVNIPAAFALSVYETSVAEYRAFCEATAHPCSQLPAGQDDYPVTSVTWHDAKGYAAWISERTGARYRLPSEAEWEFAARAGTTTRYPFGDDVNQAQAVYATGGSSGPLPRSKSVVPNEFGLRHMVGNVAEWVEDAWFNGYAGAPADGSARIAESDERVVRGGAFNDPKGGITSASRRMAKAREQDAHIGFRVVREL